MEKLLVKNGWEIFDLARKQDVDVGVARDMFIENLNTCAVGEAIHYPGADVDYLALAAQWRAMTAEEQAAEKALYSAAVRALYDELAVCRRKVDREKFDALMTAYEIPVKEDEEDAEQQEH